MNKKRFGELRFRDFSRTTPKWKMVEKRSKGGWKEIGIIDAKREELFITETIYLDIETMEKIIMYIKLNREIWQRFTYPSANALGLYLKMDTPVRYTRGLPVEGLLNHKKKGSGNKEPKEESA